MPKMDVEGDLTKAEKRVGDLEKGLKTLGGMQKKKYAEFETLNNALYEGKELIEDNQKALKKESDPKKIKALAEEMEEAEKTFKKMAAKRDTVVKELGDMGTTATNLLRSFEVEEKGLNELEKALTRSGGDVKEMKAWSNTIKTLLKTASSSMQTAKQLADEPKSLPKLAKL
jgi:DNA repair ATPase RecN